MKTQLIISIITNCGLLLMLIFTVYRYVVLFKDHQDLRKLASSGAVLAGLAKQCEGMAELFSPASTSEQKTEGLKKAKEVKPLDISYM